MACLIQTKGLALSNTVAELLGTAGTGYLITNMFELWRARMLVRCGFCVWHAKTPNRLNLTAVGEKLVERSKYGELPVETMFQLKVIEHAPEDSLK